MAILFWGHHLPRIEHVHFACEWPIEVMHEAFLNLQFGKGDGSALSFEARA